MRCALGPDGLLYITYANAPGLSAINNGAVYKLDTNSGIWTNITPPDTSANLWYGYCAVGADPQRNRTVVVGTWNRWSPGDDFYRSTDGGTTWNSVKRLACSILLCRHLSTISRPSASGTLLSRSIPSIPITPFMTPATP